ncbi:DUF2946 family protein [Aerosticca soli]|uniref:DUF2946 domain-containing protein n=1 Tax=Aerosticca soli TaxID=2010829 RepID=A0A2Z6E327_9GAMM|nr:DUF2946 family protein [Aerosticca soli]MDI3262077.1 DUF2946 family protein [Fulvimonas sp.]BBD79460.1 hypothetical protein ALSL_0794 [Aerosticca soli]
MFRRRTTRRFVAWLAIAALWLLAAAPTFSRVLDVAPDWPELGAWCTSHGLDLHHPDAPSDPAHLDACGYCTLCSHSPLLDAPIVALPTPPLPAMSVPLVDRQAGPPTVLVLAARPRGPPLLIRPA